MRLSISVNVMCSKKKKCDRTVLRIAQKKNSVTCTFKLSCIEKEWIYFFQATQTLQRANTGFKICKRNMKRK